jgi:nucleoside-diphosphate-sugar epimerase
MSLPPGYAVGSPALVTGGTGFLGRRLVERLLAQGRPVTVFSRHLAPDLARRGVRFIRASLLDTDTVENACRGMDTVFHVAARVGVWGSYDDFFKTNVIGTRAVVAGCQKHGVQRLVYTSTPSVVYNGSDLSGVNESVPLTTGCPSAYPLTKAIAERYVLQMNTDELRTIALRPHLIWGINDPHLMPRIVQRARAHKLRIVGFGHNRVDLVHVENAVDAHLLAEAALFPEPMPVAAGKAYFITNGEPVALWEWINQVLQGVGEEPIRQKISLRSARLMGALCEAAWKVLPLKGEPPMTRFVASELATDHWFSIAAARRDLGYNPRITMAAGTAELIHWLKQTMPPAAAQPQTA